MTGNWTEELPLVRRLDEEAKNALRQRAVRVNFHQGKTIFRAGDACGQFPFVASGSIRVQRVTETGREIVLYRVNADQTCILTTASLLSSETYAAEAVAETDVVAYLIGSGLFKELMDQSVSFRGLVFAGYASRIASLMLRIEELICTRVDVRLAERLLALMDADRRIATTQQTLAADLGTAREVIGRLLNAFERSGWVKLSRGAIRINDARALGALIGARRG